MRSKVEVESAAASFRVSTMSVLLGIGSVDASLNTNSTSACTFDSARVLETALERKGSFYSLYLHSCIWFQCWFVIQRWKKAEKKKKYNLTYNCKWLGKLHRCKLL